MARDETRWWDAHDSVTFLVESGATSLWEGDLPGATRLLELADEVAAAADGVPGRTALRLLTRRQLGMARRLEGRYEEAERLLSAALAVAEDAPARYANELVELCNELGILFRYTGRFDQAAAFYHRARSLLRQSGAPEGATMASILHNLGGLAHARGDFAAAEEPARRAVHLRTRLMGEKSVEVAADKGALAAVLMDLGRLDEAESLLVDCLTVVEEHYGPDHIETGIVLGNLAALSHKRGRYAQAEVGFSRCLLVKERHFGRSHPELAVTLNNLALLMRRREDIEGARHMWRRALTVLEGSVREEHLLLRTVRKALRSLPGEERRLTAASRTEGRDPIGSNSAAWCDTPRVYGLRPRLTPESLDALRRSLHRTVDELAARDSEDPRAGEVALVVAGVPLPPGEGALPAPVGPAELCEGPLP
ncbi:tetratricopeptide repeat protein [Streptomyces sp. ODS05-4]|uniref:tetratricopeptide repeat protein n=1 Tax=Streptomyces sp. ODS05-4 TaxID=2944939 RepID=UPI00210E3C7C|nr:tetratricopeptide repeat protein [Streptomyces sp. ODS05-4]